MERFNGELIGKNGKPVKAFSYFGTAAKNYILYIKIQNDKKIAKYGGELDISDFCNTVEDQTYDKTLFVDKKKEVIDKLKQLSLSNNSSKNDVLVCNCLVYMLKNWDSLEFSSKNEFNRLLLNYTGLKNNTVTLSLKKIKSYLNLKNNG
jgi:hypothetical protein